MKKKKHALRGLIIGFWLVLLSVGLLNAATIYVDPDGSDSNNGLSPSSPFLTIQHAVEYVASHGGPTNNNVILLAGSWSTQVINEVSACENWTSNLLIQGEHGNVQLNVTNYCTRLTFKSFKTTRMKMLRPADYCKMEDLVGVGYSHWDISASHITFLRCRATDSFEGSGDIIRVAAEGHNPDLVPGNILFEDCCFRGADTGEHIDVLQIMGVSGLTMRNCKLWHAPTGLIIPTTINGVPLENLTLENCYFGEGKLYTGSRDWTVTNCDLDVIVMYSTNKPCTWTGNKIRYLDKGVGDNPGDVFENNIIRTVGYEDGHRIQLPPNNIHDADLVIPEAPCPADDPDVQAPSVPNGLSAGLITGSSIELSWNASTDDYGVTGYKVYKNGSNPVTVTGTSTTLSNLTPQTQYSLTVSAYDNAGNESAQSSALAVSTIELDTQAPSVPTGLSVGTVTASTVNLSWNASTDNVGVTSYNVYINGSNPVNVTGTSTTIENLADDTQYSFTVSALDLEDNESAQSSSVNATTLELSGVVSNSSWQSFTETTQTGTFTATFDAVPSAANIDAVTGIQDGVASAYGDLACIVRFNSSGQIDARDGGTYTATNSVNYSAGVNYHFRVEIDVPSHTYDVYVTPQGGSEQVVASGFAFRTEQASVSQLTGWAIYAYIGSHAVDNMTFSTGAGDTQAPSVPTGLATGTVTSSSVALSWTASTDNIAVTGYKVYTDGSNPVTVAGISATISNLTADTQYSFTVSAVDAAGNESAQSTLIMATTQSVSTLTGYFVDPATGSISNDGSEGSPWSTLEEVFAAGKTFQAGDVIYLKNGDHGWPDVTQSNTGEVTITSYPGDNPVINRLDFNGASNWTVEGVRIYNPAAPPETPVLTHPVYGKFGNYLVRITESSYITLDNCYIYSIENSSEWTADDWNYKAWCGVFLYTNSDHSTIKNCLLKNLNFAIDTKGTNSNTIQYNTIKNYCGDGLRVSSNSVIEYNEILDNYGTNGNHGDAMQAFASNGAIVRGNKIFSTTSATRSFINYGSQGLGFFDGWFDNYVIENNLIVIHTWQGLALYGARNSKIVNNTVVKNPLGSSSYGPPWVAIFNHKDGSASTGNVINNNLTSDLESTVGSSTSNNIVTTSYTSHFTDYAGLDFSLQATSSAVDGGTSSDAPDVDIDQYLRSGTPDVGCYEYNSTQGGSDLIASASADVISGDAPLTVNFTGNASEGNPGTGSFVESGGEIVMEAENFMRSLTNSDVTDWEISTSLSGYAGSGYITTPDDGVSGPGWGSACEVQYDIEISTSGTYNIWLLRNAPDNADNSAFVGIDGTQHSNIDNVNDISGWYWASLGSISISSGSHTFSIQRREDGYNIDKIILTTSGSTPSGNAQTESSTSVGYTFSWNFGDGSTSSEQNPSHTYTSVGSYNAVLTVSDGINNAQDNVSITVNNPVVPVTDVNVSPISVTLSVGDTATIVATVTPSNATDKSVTWVSDNTSVATVDTNGLVTAIAVGQAMITVTTVDGGYIAASDIQVPDTDAPSVPTGLASGTITSSSVALSWTASTDNIGVTGYKVYTDGSSPVSVAGTSTTISNLTAETQYSFTVSAVDSAGNESTQSSSIQVTTDETSTGIIVDETIQAEDYSTVSGCSQSTLHSGYTGSSFLDFGGNGTWAEWTTTLSNNVTIELSLRYANGSTDNRQCNLTVNGSSVGNVSFSPTGGWTTWDTIIISIDVVEGTNTIRLTANTSYGGPNLDKLDLDGEVGGDTQAPSIPTGLAAGTVTETTVDLSWTASTDNEGVTGYKVYTDASGLVTVTGTSTTISNLTAATQYSFTVSAVDAAGNESAQSSAVQVTTQSVLPANDTLNPIADAYVRAGASENNNYGTDDELAIKNNYIAYVREAYLKFDLSSVASPVTSAVLRLYLNDADPSTHYLKFVSDNSWTETGITYANAPSVGSTLASWSASAAGFIEVDITSTVESEVGSMLSLHISASSNSEWAAYDSREGVNKPELIIVAGDTGVTSTSAWQSFDVSVQTGTFTAEFDVVPNAQGLDNVVGIQDGVGDFWSDLACAIRFNTSNTIDARNGGSYAAATSVSYTAGTSYHFRLEIDVPSHTYSIYVTPQGQSEITLGTDYAFRAEQQIVTQLTGWSLQALSGSHTVRNMSFVSTSSAEMGFTQETIASGLTINMYPNPVSGDVLTVQLSGYNMDEAINVHIVDLMGRLVYSQLYAEQTELQIPVNHLSNGIYVISVNGKQQKLVIE